MKSASTMSDRDRLDISFVIPARNESLLIQGTLQSIHAAVAPLNKSYEIIVANDDSTDHTADIARDCGARVVDVKLHNIGAVRNAGAAVAVGRVLFFLDADTQLPEKTLAAALRALDDGAIGGGGNVGFETRLTLFQRFLVAGFTWYWLKWNGWAAGCNIFVNRADFEAVGGFNTEYFAAEERYLSIALKQRGRFVIIKEQVITSARKLRIYSTSQLIKLGIRALILERGQLKRREGLEFLYDAPRETDNPLSK